jgi:hypothetical protein
LPAGSPQARIEGETVPHFLQRGSEIALDGMPPGKAVAGFGPFPQGPAGIRLQPFQIGARLRGEPLPQLVVIFRRGRAVNRSRTKSLAARGTAALAAAGNRS